MVVGGTLGIGRALALGLAAAGADVVATSRSEEGVESTAAEIEAMGRRTMRIVSDVTDRATLVPASRCGTGRVQPEWIFWSTPRAAAPRIPTLECTEEIWRFDYGHQPDRKLRACQVFSSTMLEHITGLHPQHRVDGHVCSVPRGHGLRREQSMIGSVALVAGGGVGATWRSGERDCTRHFSHCVEPRIVGIGSRA